MTRAFLVGRILVGGYYLQSAIHHFTNVGQMARYTAAHGVPAPQLAVIIGGVLLLIAGLSFLLGIYPRLGVAALVLFLVPVTLIMHAFWADRDPMQRQNDLINFTKNVALLGSSLMFLAVPRPWPYSIERRLHLPLRRAMV
jgi:putative oxidoreductase